MHTYTIVEKGKAVDKASKALILLHGRGGSPEDILSLADYFCDESFYIAAPFAANHTWYPNSFMADEKTNEPWLSSAIGIVKRLLDETSQFIPLEQIYLMGFSQGACLTLETAARYANRYGGIIAFTGGLIGKNLDRSHYSGDFAGTKIFIGTSDLDPHVPLERAIQSKEIMEQEGGKVFLQIYKGMAHTIIQEEIDFVKTNIFGRF